MPKISPQTYYGLIHFFCTTVYFVNVLDCVNVHMAVRVSAHVSVRVSELEQTRSVCAAVGPVKRPPLGAAVSLMDGLPAVQRAPPCDTTNPAASHSRSTELWDIKTTFSCRTWDCCEFKVG